MKEDNNVVSINIDDPVLVSSKPRRGRPPKALVESKKLGNRGKIGRPAGDAARIQEMKARLLSTTGSKVINKIVSIAMDDSHAGQMAALKMCMDRVLPTSLFEKDAKGQRNAVTINITGIGETKVEQAEIIENGYEDVDYNES